MNMKAMVNGRILLDMNTNLDISRVLEAAGQRSRGICKEPDNAIFLKNICRQAIREHLLHLDQHENLFVRVPHLGLPSSLNSFLFNYMFLD